MPTTRIGDQRSMISSANFGIPMKSRLAIAAIFKHENAYLREWIEFHRLVGFDHFFLDNLISDLDHLVKYQIVL